MLECLENLIGITESENACILKGLTAEEKLYVKKAREIAGDKIYLDDLQGGVHMKALQSIDATKSFFQLTKTAVNNAIKTLAHDITINLSTRYEKSNHNFVGTIGQAGYAASLFTNRQWQGVKIMPTSLTDASVKITGIKGVLNEAGQLMIRILKVLPNSVMGVEVISFPVEVNANTYFYLNLPKAIELPFNEKGVIYEYWIVYDRYEISTTVLPKDTALTGCKTCTGDTRVKFTDYLNVSGVAFTSLDSLNNSSDDRFSHGLVIDVEISCQNSILLCRQFQEKEEVALGMAYAARFKAGELLIEAVQQSPDINQYTTMATEYLWGKRNHFVKEYQGRLGFLTYEGINAESGNCYTCKQQDNQPFVGTIFS